MSMLRFPVMVSTQGLVMEQARLALMVAAALTATAFNANAQDGDVAVGRTFALEACDSCHIVEPTNASPRVVAIAPSFQDVANTKGMTATALRVFLTTSHPKMPNLILTPQEIVDVSAYILSLRDPPALLTRSCRRARYFCCAASFFPLRRSLREYHRRGRGYCSDVRRIIAQLG